MRLLLGMESLENAGVLWFINGMINNRFCDIFWFFTELFACYLCIPVLSLIPKESRLKCFNSLAAIGILTVSVLPTVCHLIGVQYNSAIKLPLVGNGYLLYVIIGYILSESDTKRWQRGVIYLLGACGFATHFIGTVMLSLKNGYIDFTFKGYMNFPCLFYSVAVFVFVKNIAERLPGFVYGVCSKCAGATFGVYILHYAFLEFYIRPTEAVNHDHILFRTVGTVLLFVLCILLTKLIQRIPLIKHLIPS
jgi:surface polysaccharide O-acyltransferase-like enzyme